VCAESQWSVCDSTRARKCLYADACSTFIERSHAFQATCLGVNLPPHHGIDGMAVLHPASWEAFPFPYPHCMPLLAAADGHDYDVLCVCMFRGMRWWGSPCLLTSFHSSYLVRSERLWTSQQTTPPAAGSMQSYASGGLGSGFF
jgi:hypothetical protein